MNITSAVVHSDHLSIALLPSPTLPQIQTAAEWLTEQSYPNPDMEIALNLVLQGQVIPQGAPKNGW